MGQKEQKEKKITLVLRVSPRTAELITKTASAFEGWSEQRTKKSLKRIENEN